MRASLMLLFAAGCHVVLGEYTVGDETGACSSDADCDAGQNEGCDDGRCAIRCLTDAVCPAFSECFAADFCTEPIGTPCDPAIPHACGGYACQDRDVDAMPVDGYCPGYCNPPEVACPEGFTCLQLRCYRS